MQILKDYFRNSANVFIDFVYDYKLLTDGALYELEYIQTTQNNIEKKHYEDYRNLLGILSKLATRNCYDIYKDKKNKIAFETTPILRSDSEIKKYLQTKFDLLFQLSELGNTDAHNLSIQELDESQIVKDFICKLIFLIEGFPVLSPNDSSAKTKAIESLKQLKQLVFMDTEQ